MMTGQDVGKSMYTRSMAVVIVTRDKPFVKDGIAVYPAAESCVVSGAGQYIDLLSSSNIRWDILAPAGICRDAFIGGGTIRYAAAIFTVPFATLSDEQMAVVRDLAFEHGISLISAFNLPDQRSKGYFGVRMFRGRKFLWPLKVRISRWTNPADKPEVLADYGLKAGFPGLRKGGFRKLSFRQSFAKAGRLLRNLSLPYMAADLDPAVQILATTIAGKPVAWSHRFGHATNYYFALDDKRYLCKFNEMHRLVHSVIMANSGHGMASVCLQKTMVVRLDDPGACKTDHLDTGKLLDEADWEELAANLHPKDIPLSVMYTPGWVDDGDDLGGTLFLNGKKAIGRRPGNIHDSAAVSYRSFSGRQRRYDHSSEYRGLKRLLRENRIDIHSHGLTHLDPDHDNWSKARDRRTDSRWYHEFFHVKKNSVVKKEVQLQAMIASKEKIEDLFDVSPYAFTPSGHMHDTDCDILAHNAGYSLFSSDYTGIAKDNLLIRNKRIVSIFLNFKEPTVFAKASGYPVIGIVHDYELKNNVGKLIELTNKWKQKGIERFITLKDLVASLCATIDARYCASESVIRLDIQYSDRLINHRRHFTLAGALVTLHIRMPAHATTSEAKISVSNGTLLSVERTADHLRFSLGLGTALSYRLEVPVIKSPV